jgi:hypothetical protein
MEMAEQAATKIIRLGLNVPLQKKPAVAFMLKHPVIMAVLVALENRTPLIFHIKEVLLVLAK